MKTATTTKKSNLEDNFLIGPLLRFFKANMGILIGFIILFLIMSLTADNFATTTNYVNVMRTVSTNCFLAIGVMMAIMLGGIDLTGGALIALSGCVTIVCLDRYAMPIAAAVIVGLLIGLVVGFANGVIIAYTGIHPFVVTLAMQSVCRGGAYLIANGQPVSIMNDSFTKLGNGFLGPIPLPVIYMAFFLFCAYLLLNKTKVGRHVFAVGGNPTAARFSGIDIKKVKILVWTLSGFLASFAGVVLASRMSSGQPAVGLGFETDAIAASVLGGTSMYGGVGTVGGMFIGVLVIGCISNGLNLLHVNSYWQYVAKGGIILIAVYIDMYKTRKQNSRKE